MNETHRPNEVSATPKLQRSAEDRMVAGVCGGLAEFTGLDPVIFRVAFAVAAILGGAGLMAYALAWLLIPDANKGRSHAESLLRDRGVPRIVMIVIGVIAVLILADALDGPFRHNSGGGGLGLIVLVGVGVWFFTRDGSQLARTGGAPAARPAPPDAPTSVSPYTVEPVVDAGPGRDDVEVDSTTVGPTLRPQQPRSKLFLVTFSTMLLVAGVLAAVQASDAADIGVGPALALCLLVVGTGLLVGTWYGRARLLIPVGLLLTLLAGVATIADVPIAGGTGERLWNPTTIDRLEPEYRLAAGRGTLDLRDLTVASLARRVEVSVGVGQLEVRLPAGVDVEVDARAGFGEVAVLGRETEGVDVTQRRQIDGDGAERLVLDLDVGMGRVEVTR